MPKLKIFILFWMTLVGFIAEIDAAVTPPSGLAKVDATNSALAKKGPATDKAALQAKQTMNYLDLLSQNSECGRFLDEIKRVKSVLIDSLLAKKNLQNDKITLFVPSDQAMKDFGKVGLFHLKRQQVQDALLRFVGYHVVLGTVSHQDIKNIRRKVRTVTGQEFALGNVSQAVLYSVEMPTATIHVINNVLVDPELKRGFLAKYYAASTGSSKNQGSESLQLGAKGFVTALDVLEKFSVCSRFLDEIKNIKRDTLLVKQRLTGGDITLFIPTNDAMITFGKVDLLRSTKPEDVTLLTKFVDYHFVQETIAPAGLKNSQRRVKTISKKEYKLADVASFVEYSIETDDSIVHVIKNVLIDPELKTNFVN